MNFDLTVQVSKRKEFIWNLLGSIANASTSVILLMATTQIAGTTEAGLFSLAIANAQLFITIGNFGVRPYQATDIYNRFQFEIYCTHRIVTCIFMLLISFLYCLINHSNDKKFIVIILFTILKLVDAFADVLEGYMQQLNRLDLAGFAWFFRTALYSAAYSCGLWFSRDIITAALAAIGVAVLCLYLMLFMPVQRHRGKIHVQFDTGLMWQLTKECFPLFFTLFLMMYLINVPKYVIDNQMSLDNQTYYNIIYMPAQVINLLSVFAFKPLLTQMAEYWNNNKVRELKQYIYRLYVYILGITILAMGSAYVMGIPVLSLIYGVELGHLKPELLVILIGGGFNAVVNMLYYVLTALRMQKNILISYVVVSLVAYVIASWSVKRWELMGAVCAYVVLMCLLAVWMTISMYRCIARQKC
mgnify:CR=1 FL=1